jgi:hypothetical protein
MRPLQVLAKAVSYFKFLGDDLRCYGLRYHVNLNCIIILIALLLLEAFNLSLLLLINVQRIPNSLIVHFYSNGNDEKLKLC